MNVITGVYLFRVTMLINKVSFTVISLNKSGLEPL